MYPITLAGPDARMCLAVQDPDSEAASSGLQQHSPMTGLGDLT